MAFPFGTWLRARLAERGLRQVDLARLLRDRGFEVTDSAVCFWVGGTSRPAPRHLTAVCDALGLDSDGRLEAMAAHARDREGEAAPDAQPLKAAG